MTVGSVLPQVEVVFPEIHLGLDQLVWVFQQLLEQILEGLADDRGIDQGF
jgi:hypothetical protein